MKIIRLLGCHSFYFLKAQLSTTIVEWFLSNSFFIIVFFVPVARMFSSLCHPAASTRRHRKGEMTKDGSINSCPMFCEGGTIFRYRVNERDGLEKDAEFFPSI